jgi:hypothetical protein
MMKEEKLAARISISRGFRLFMEKDCQGGALIGLIIMDVKHFRAVCATRYDR